MVADNASFVKPKSDYKMSNSLSDEDQIVLTSGIAAFEAKNFGQANDPMVGGRIGGVNVFGGGLALYNEQGELIGAIGVSGDTSCTDHVVAWKVRHALELDYVPGGVHPERSDDNAVYTDEGDSPWEHPVCDGAVRAITDALPAVRSTDPE